MIRRTIAAITPSTPTVEGAGVRLRRAFGFGKTETYDPFLLLDDFRGDEPSAYSPGFPRHPHRGIETITYMLKGSVAHADSLGNRGIIGPGGVQWMTAGSGIIHEEMPEGDETGCMHGFQLWANLPRSKKMTAPRYQEFSNSEIPVAPGPNGARARIIAGSLWGIDGPVEGIAASPAYFDIEIPHRAGIELEVPRNRHAFAYVIEGSGDFGNSAGSHAKNRDLVLYGEGDTVAIQSGEEGVRFLLVSGLPLKEPVAWYGPIVMNTQQELATAFRELEEGTFLRPPP